MRKQLKPVPDFADEAEERAFWKFTIRPTMSTGAWPARRACRSSSRRPRPSHCACPGASGADQARGQPARRALPVADQAVAGGEGRRRQQPPLTRGSIGAAVLGVVRWPATAPAWDWRGRVGKTLPLPRMSFISSFIQRVSPECAWLVEPVRGAALPTQADRRRQAEGARPARQCSVERHELGRGVAGGEVEGVREVEARLETVERPCGDRRVVERELVEVDQAPQAVGDRRPRHPVAGPEHPFGLQEDGCGDAAPGCLGQRRQPARSGPDRRGPGGARRCSCRGQSFLAVLPLEIVPHLPCRLLDRRVHLGERDRRAVVGNAADHLVQGRPPTQSAARAARRTRLALRHRARCRPAIAAGREFPWAERPGPCSKGGSAAWRPPVRCGVK